MEIRFTRNTDDQPVAIIREKAHSTEENTVTITCEEVTPGHKRFHGTESELYREWEEDSYKTELLLRSVIDVLSNM